MLNLGDLSTSRNAFPPMADTVQPRGAGWITRNEPFFTRARLKQRVEGGILARCQHDITKPGGHV